MSDSAILEPIVLVTLNLEAGGERIGGRLGGSGYTIIYRRRVADVPMVRLRFGCSGLDCQEWIGPVYRHASEPKLLAYSRIFDPAQAYSRFYRVARLAIG